MRRPRKAMRFIERLLHPNPIGNSFIGPWNFHHIVRYATTAIMGNQIELVHTYFVHKFYETFGNPLVGQILLQTFI